MDSNGKFVEGFCNYNDNQPALCGRLRLASNYERARYKCARETQRTRNARGAPKIVDHMSSESRANRVFCPPSYFRLNWALRAVYFARREIYTRVID